MRAFLLIVVLSVCGYSFAESEPPIPTPTESGKREQTPLPKAKYEATKNLRGTHDSPFVVDILPVPNADKIAERKSEQENEKSTLDGLIAWSTIALAVITFFLALFTACLWASTKKLVTGAEDTAQRQLRAYLSITPAGLEKINPNEMFHFRFTCLNGGQTPAYSVRYNGILDIIEHPISENYPFPALPRKLPYLAMVPPRTPIGGHLLATNKINKADIVEILTGKGEGEGKRLYIFGQIDYIDAFGKNHWTRFCYSFPGWNEAIALAKMDKWEEIAKILRQPGFALNMEFAIRHNITDDG